MIDQNGSVVLCSKQSIGEAFVFGALSLCFLSFCVFYLATMVLSVNAARFS